MKPIIAAMAAVALATLVACGGDAAVAPVPLAGTWTLQSANGSALPFVQSSNSTGKIVDDQLVVSGGGTFTEQGHQRVTYASPPAVTTGPYVYTGTYSATGTTVVFLFDGGATGTAARSGAQLTVVFQAGTFVYSKQ